MLILRIRFVACQHKSHKFSGISPRFYCTTPELKPSRWRGVEKILVRSVATRFLDQKTSDTDDTQPRHCTQLYMPKKCTGPNNKPSGDSLTGQQQQRAGSSLFLCCLSVGHQEMKSTKRTLDLPEMTTKAVGHHVSYLHTSTKCHLELPIATTTEEAAFFASLDGYTEGNTRAE